jgi:hypothetical protein
MSEPGQPDLMNLVDPAQAPPAFPWPSRYLFWLDGVPQFMQVSQVA